MKFAANIGMVAAFIILMPNFSLAEKAPTVGETVLGVEVNVARVITSGYSANDLIGSTVLNDAKKEVGTVHDLIVSTDGDVSLAIIEVGGFVGLGSKWVAVPASMFEPGEGRDVVLPKASEAALKDMPPFRYANR